MEPVDELVDTMGSTDLVDAWVDASVLYLVVPCFVDVREGTDTLTESEGCVVTKI